MITKEEFDSVLMGEYGFKQSTADFMWEDTTTSKGVDMKIAGDLTSLRRHMRNPEMVEILRTIEEGLGMIEEEERGDN